MADCDKPFKGKRVLVTGGSRGIGKAIALAFASRGADVAFNYLRGHDAAAESQREIEALDVRCLRVKAHLGDTKKIKELFAEIQREFGGLDILINNAASGVQRTVLELDEKQWDWTMDINAKAAWLCSLEAVRLMTDGGSIVNITSLGSQRVLPYYFVVGVSKGALETMTRYLAVELAPKGISVNAISGGYIETRPWDYFPNRDEMREQGMKTLMGRMLTPEDIANAALFLCSPEASAIRGQVIAVDGGVTLKAWP